MAQGAEILRPSTQIVRAARLLNHARPVIRPRRTTPPGRSVANRDPTVNYNSPDPGDEESRNSRRWFPADQSYNDQSSLVRSPTADLRGTRDFAGNESVFAFDPGMHPKASRPPSDDVRGDTCHQSHRRLLADIIPTGGSRDEWERPLAWACRLARMSTPICLRARTQIATASHPFRYCLSRHVNSTSHRPCRRRSGRDTLGARPDPRI